MIRILTLLCLSISLLAAEENALKTANVYAQTGFYAEAESVYRKLLSEPLEAWQQDLLFYNLGTLFVYQELWNEAIEEFIEVNGENLSPELLSHLQNNLSMALTGEAQKLVTEGNQTLAITLLSIYDANGDLFSKIWESLPPDPARDTLLRAIREGGAPNLEPLTGYPLQLATVAANSSETTQKIALIAALGAVNRELDNPVAKSEAVKILSQAIEEQQRSWDLAFLINVFKIRAPEFTKLIENHQQAAIKTAHKFVPAAITLQKECQKSNWDNVFPPFGQGLQAAEYSQQLLQKQQPLPIVDDYQSETLKLWNIALENLFIAESAQAPKEEKVIASRNVEQLIQTVIEMELQDESPRKKVPDVKRIDRPW